MGIGCIGLFVFTASSRISQAADNDVMTDNNVVIKREGGHRLLLPKDWPIEHEHGVISPVPVEQYLSIKFNQVQERFSEIDRTLEALEGRIQQLEKDQQITIKRVRNIEIRAQEAQQKEATDGNASQGTKAAQGEKGEFP